MAVKNSGFLDNLNKEIDRKIEMIESGKSEPVIPMKKADHILAACIVAGSLVCMILTYNLMC